MNHRKEILLFELEHVLSTKINDFKRKKFKYLMIKKIKSLKGNSIIRIGTRTVYNPYNSPWQQKSQDENKVPCVVIWEQQE